MTDALSIALSGLNAQKQRLAAGASNIANVSTSGAASSASAAGALAQGAPASVPTVYKPLNVSLTSIAGGGLSAQVAPRANGTSLSYDPSSAYANAEGLIAVPDVDLAEEAVNLMDIKTSFKADLSVVKTQDEMMKSLLDVLA